MPTLNYTTKVPVAQTMAEIQQQLASHGADAVAITYRDGRPSGLAFTLPTPHGSRTFSLPVDVAAVHALLTRQSAKNARVDARPEQAERVAWRVLREWLLAQLALIEAQMATLDQVMLPYLRVNGEQTLYAAYKAREEVALLEASYDT